MINLQLRRDEFDEVMRGLFMLKHAKELTRPGHVWWTDNVIANVVEQAPPDYRFIKE